MLWPGPDHRAVDFPGPDHRTANFPGPDARVVAFPPTPIPRALVDLAAVGGGTAGLAFALRADAELAAAGGGSVAALATAVTSVDLGAVGGGRFRLAQTLAEIDLEAVGGGAAGLVVVPVVPVAVSGEGGGVAGLAVVPRALVDLGGIGGGAAGLTVAPRAAAVLAAVGGGEAEFEIDVISDGVTYADDFNRASLGSNWTTIGSLAPVIATSDRAQAGTGQSINTTVAYVARYVTAVLTDNHRSGATLATPTGSANLALGVGLTVRGATGGDRVEAVVTTTTATIFTKTGGSGGTSTSRANQTGLSISTGAYVELVASGTTYTVYVNGVSVVSWADAGGVISIDSSHRYVGVAPIANRSFAGTYAYGWALDDWTGKDD